MIPSWEPYICTPNPPVWDRRALLLCTDAEQTFQLKSSSDMSARLIIPIITDSFVMGHWALTLSAFAIKLITTWRWHLAVSRYQCWHGPFGLCVFRREFLLNPISKSLTVPETNILIKSLKSWHQRAWSNPQNGCLRSTHSFQRRKDEL